MHPSIQYEIAKARIAEMQQQADRHRAIRAARQARRDGQDGVRQPGKGRQDGRARRGWRLPGIRAGAAVSPAAPGPATPAGR